MTQAILTLNAGSSSLKFALFPVTDDFPALMRGKIAGIGTAARFTATDHDGKPVTQPMGVKPDAQHDALIPDLLRWLGRQFPDVTITAVGHRVVHGGRSFKAPTLITPEVLDTLTDLVPLAPLHQPHNLAAIRRVATLLPKVPQVACFDTSFHRTQDRLAQLFALPRAMTDDGVIRYGFHGLSYDYIAGVLPDYTDRAQGKVVVAHLGNGASMCALSKGRSTATSMGFTALDGLMMGQRCGAIDPGVLLYLMDAKGMTAAQLSTLLYTQSGLLGVSGISPDMAVLQASTAPQAHQAIDLFCYRAANELTALATANGGLDAIVFTAGIGERSALVRAQICERLAWLGVDIDPEANAENAQRISTDTSAIEVLVIATDEEIVIAEATRRWA
ncbi:acetate/propionate family kinase [Loktanella salsilacus]|uniref:acetate/propionate family kinase n=1 Tax=Loktanella salsilacus TaxID=195913 RepID=UPI00356B2EC5